MVGTGTALVLGGLAGRTARHPRERFLTNPLAAGLVPARMPPGSSACRKSWPQLTESLNILAATRVLSVQPTDLQDLDPEGLQPGEQPVQSRLISNRAVQDGLNRFHRGGQPVEVKQRLGRENT